MKVGEIFELPEGVRMIAGSRGNIKNENKIIGKYEVVEVKEENKKVLKCKVIVTYGNKRSKNS